MRVRAPRAHARAHTCSRAHPLARTHARRTQGDLVEAEGEVLKATRDAGLVFLLVLARAHAAHARAYERAYARR